MYKYGIAIISAGLLIFTVFKINQKHAVTLWKHRFEAVLDDIQRNSIKNYEWNADEWQKYRDKQLSQLPITNEASFHKAVTQALADLGDHHSCLLSNACMEQVTKQVAQHESSVMVEDGIGIIVVPPVINYEALKDTTQLDVAFNETWVSEFQNQINAASKDVTRGWIIDLTENFGGNMYPMLAALSRFYQTPQIGGFYGFNEGKHALQIVTFDGQSFAVDGNVMFTYNNRYPINQNRLPIVVLIGPKTASSAEFVTLALQRQNNVVVVGQPTSGFASGNAIKSLPDNLGHYALTGALFLDSNNKPFLEQRINPAIEVPDDKAGMLQKAKDIILNNKRI